MIVEPESARYTLESTTGRLQASIPARRNWLIILFLTDWLGGWVMGEMSAAHELLSAGDKTPSAFLMLWLAGWTLGGGYCLMTILWQIAGREILRVDSSALEYRVEIFGIGLSRTYRLTEIKNLRTAYNSRPMTWRAWYPPFGGNAYGPIAFDYGARTIRLAPSLEEAEAAMLVRELEKNLAKR